MNICLMIIDTLRYDYIGAHGNTWMKTPNMDRLAAESYVFDNSFLGSFPTIPHRTDVLTGEYGSPFHIWTPLRHDRVAFPPVLAEGGYGTQLIHDTPHLVNGGHNFDWPFHAWTPVRGAEVDRPWIDDSHEWLANWKKDPLFDFAPEDCLKKNRTAVTYARANRRRVKDEDWNCARLFLTASEFLKDNRSRENFFLWVDCFDPHEPWDAPPEMMKLYVDDEGYDGTIDPRSWVVMNDERMTDAARERVCAQYAAKVSWVDRWVGRLLDTLDETGLAAKTAVILTADHGTHVNDYGRFGKRSPVMEPVGHTPMMLRMPGEGSGRVSAFVQPQDVFATVCDIAGVDVPPGRDSRSMLRLARGDASERREFALCGPAASHRWEKPGAKLCTVFDAEWAAEIALEPEDCVLRRRGSEEVVTSGNDEVVARLHGAAIDELARRGTDERLMAWIRGGGAGEFPKDAVFWDGYPGPNSFTQYFNRLYMGE